MSIKEIAVNTTTLQSDITEMEAALAAVDQATEDMFQSIRELSGMWTGIAHDAFLQQVTIDYEKMKELHQVIMNLKECMHQARKDYESCENSISTIINGINI